jgi:hypothetical protein
VARDVGNGIMRADPRPGHVDDQDYRKPKDIARRGFARRHCRHVVASVMEKLTGGIDWATAIGGYWVPAIIGNTLVTVILLPILMVAYQAVVSRRGR